MLGKNGLARPLGVLYESSQPVFAGTSLCLRTLWNVGLCGSRVPSGRTRVHRRTLDCRQGLALVLCRASVTSSAAGGEIFGNHRGSGQFRVEFPR
jgi:hypothetical protein